MLIVIQHLYLQGFFKAFSLTEPGLKTCKINKEKNTPLHVS